MPSKTKELSFKQKESQALADIRAEAKETVKQLQPQVDRWNEAKQYLADHPVKPTKKVKRPAKRSKAGGATAADKALRLYKKAPDGGRNIQVADVARHLGLASKTYAYHVLGEEVKRGNLRKLDRGVYVLNEQEQKEEVSA